MSQDALQKASFSLTDSFILQRDDRLVKLSDVQHILADAEVERDLSRAVVDAARRFVEVDEAIESDAEAFDIRGIEAHLALYSEWKRLRFGLRDPVHALDGSREDT